MEPRSLGLNGPYKRWVPRMYSGSRTVTDSDVNWLSMRTMMWRTLAIIALASGWMNDETLGQTSPNCRGANNCTACVLAGPLCAWCFQQDLVLTARCDLLPVLESSGCNRSNIFVPQSRVTVLQNDALRNAEFNSNRPAVQLAPQRVRARLAPGRPANFSLQFRVAKDYPVDLYYLMDLSLSMEDDVETLTKLGLQLQQALLRITGNVRLGFGAFIDKPVKPFINVRPEALENSCYPARNCDATYSYINRLALTNDTGLFVSRVMTSAISGNLDGAEGGLDALVQAIACQESVQWRNASRRLVVYASDNMYKMAGDGKLGGIMEPNDGVCHLTDNQYTHSTIMDYPSVGQIAGIVKSKSVNVIFAIAEKHKAYYEQLAQLMPGSVVAVLDNESRNAVELVKDNYQAIIAKASLSIDGLDGDGSITVKTRSSCLSGQSVETKTCDGLRIGDTVSFDVQLVLNSCRAVRNGGVLQKELYISVVGVEERLRIDVDVDCSCECNDKEPASSRCSLRGLYSCGTCYCDAGFSGSRCECDETTAIASAATLQGQCTRPRTTRPCSGRGVCTACGSCECNCVSQAGIDVTYCEVGDRYTGKFCECNPRGCNSFNGLICGGLGACRCDAEGRNYCDCNEQFENGAFAACDCPKSTATCKSNSAEDLVCNGRGRCTCGACQCTDSCYTGATCSILKPECSGSCQEFRPCVECSQPNGKQCPDSCQNVGLNNSESVPPGSLQTCRYTDDEACVQTFAFSYDHSAKRHRVAIVNDRKCPRDLIIPLVAGIVGGVLLLGLLALIIWKVAVTVYDRKEYEKFEKEAQRAKWNTDVNPLYEKATSTFKNPTYAGRL